MSSKERIPEDGNHETMLLAPSIPPPYDERVRVYMVRVCLVRIYLVRVCLGIKTEKQQEQKT